FFFSSRRRHTRFSRDWSSDVCSSDLIEELADLAGVTPNYISVIFKEVVGYTPIQYLHQLRINTAINLLKNTSMTIHEIAEYLGYYDQSYFNRMFKKWMGTNPSHFV